MSAAWWGGLAGGLVALGIWLISTRVWATRRPSLTLRVLPYVRDLPQAAALAPAVRARASSRSPAAAAAVIFGPGVRRAAEMVERIVGGSESVRRRLARAGVDRTVHEFRVEQVFWGLGGFGVTAGWLLVRALASDVDALSGIILCALGFAGGVLVRDARLSALVKERERRIIVEFPALAELLSLSVAAGESPVAALDRVVHRSRGALSEDLERVLARVRTGEPVTVAFDTLAASTGVPLVARFAHGISISMERGTPLADVLHAQAADVREAGRRALIESAARREVVMMAPVVFLVLPITIAFAFFPGVIGLSLMAP